MEQADYRKQSIFSHLLEGVEKKCKASEYEIVVYNLDRKDEDYEEQNRWLTGDIKKSDI